MANLANIQKKEFRQPTKEVLNELYHNQHFSMLECAKKIGCCDGTVLNYLRKYEIPTRTRKHAKFNQNHRGVGFNELSKETLVDLYIGQKLSPKQCAKRTGFACSTIEQYLKRYNIPTRPRVQTIFLNQNPNKEYVETTKEILIKLYIGQRMSCAQCGMVLGVSDRTIISRLNQFGIPIRSLSESHIGNYHPKEVRKKISVANKGKEKPPGYSERIGGENHWNWKGGVTLRGLELLNTNKYRYWRASVFKKDNYTCLCCGNSQGGNLEAHHAESFVTAISLRYEPSNGVTLCYTCHKMFHKTYGRGHTTKEQTECFLTTRPNALGSVG